MATATATRKRSTTESAQMGEFFGKLYSFMNSLKLYHWDVTGKASYAEHMALDQAIESISPALDRIVETSYALYGNIDITIPETPVPTNIAEHVSNFFDYCDDVRDMFKEDFSTAIIDDLQEAIMQLLYRLKRLQ